MTSPGGNLAGERRVVTALFCDVVGSTSIAETLDPEDWSEMVSGAIDSMGKVIDRFGGTVTEFAGDGLVALFGAPVAHEDDPYRAVRSGLSIVDEMRSARAEGGALEVRVGIHTKSLAVGLPQRTLPRHQLAADSPLISTSFDPRQAGGCLVHLVPRRH